MQGDTTINGPDAHQSGGTIIPLSTEVEVAGSIEKHDRANTYVALGALLASSPNEELLAALCQPAAIPQTSIELAWEVLRQAAAQTTVQSVDDEYHELFVGVGRGEVVPYGSWHQTGFLMEKPLGQLRQDLRRLGFERRADVHESEDHIASVCQVMGSIITADDIDATTERDFFNQHVASWGADFFNELQNASAARFYRAVGNLGQSFMAVETQYLSMSV